MSEYIEREALLQDISETVLFTVRGGVKPPTPEMRGANKITARIMAAPIVDAVEVVRCKECKYFREYTNEYKRNVENADGDCYLRVMYSDDYQFDAVKYCDYCSMGAKMDRKGESDV